MCTGGRLLADVTLGTTERPDVPEQLEASLTTTNDERWVVWAHKMATPAGKLFLPLIGGTPYPADAVAECRAGGGHRAPEPGCTCGFHALSMDYAGFGPEEQVWLEVALTGRVLAFEFRHTDVLFGAERQTVARICPPRPRRMREAARAQLAPLRPSDPDGRLARVRPEVPAGSGPMRLELPTATPPTVGVVDDAGLCVVAPIPHFDESRRGLVGSTMG